MLEKLAAFLLVVLTGLSLTCAAPAAAEAEVSAASIKELQAKCDGGDARSCGVLGSYYEKGEGVKKDLAAALKLWSRACSLGEGFRCALAGEAYLKGEGTAKNPARAIALKQRGCDLDDGYACSMLSIAYQAGEGVPSNPARALDLNEKACRLGAGMCDMMEFEGRSLLLDVNKPLPNIATHTRSCLTVDKGWCTTLAMRFHDGIDIESNEQAAARYYTMGCDAGDYQACANLGNLMARFNRDEYPKKLHETQHDVLALKAYLRACDLKWGTSCSLAGDMIRRGIGTPRNLALADQLRERGCVLYSMVCPKEMEAAAKARAAKAQPVTPAKPAVVVTAKPVPATPAKPGVSAPAKPAPVAAPANAAPRLTARSPIVQGSLLARGVKLYRERDMQPALAALLAAAKAEPNDPRVYAFLSSTYYSLGMTVESQMAEQMAKQLDPNAMEILR
jgi:uncharacterized protein